MKILLLFIATLFIVKSDKQEFIVDKKVALKPGFYRNFEEFKTNNPSVAFANYPITKVSRGYGFLNSAGEIASYRVVMDKSAAKKIGNVYGFCDGKNIYINPEITLFKPKKEFAKLEYLGRYCYYEERVLQTVYTGMGTGSSTGPVLEEKALDINTGKIIILSKKTIREIMVNDTQLMADFTNDSKKRKVLKEYLINYSDKHADEITR